jgi:hypothetical protein
MEKFLSVFHEILFEVHVSKYDFFFQFVDGFFNSDGRHCCIFYMKYVLHRFLGKYSDGI